MLHLNSKCIFSSIKTKMLWLNLLLAVVIITFLVFFYRSFTDTLEKEKMMQVKSNAESTLVTIQFFYDLSAAGKLEVPAAKEHAMNVLREIRFGETGYIWINGGDGVLLMQPHTPDRVGINQTNWTDVNGQYIFQKFIEKAKEGGGWVNYYWPKPDTNIDYPKISYVAYFEPWDWVIGTGEYLDEMQGDIFRIVFNASAFLFFIFFTFIVTLFIVINYYIGQLNQSSLHDAMTLLYNKRIFSEMVPKILNKQVRLKDHVLAVTFIDIDHFKQVNDCYGHDCGDRVLKKLAAEIIADTRPDDYCIRYGGEEFVIVGFYKDKTSVLNSIERLRDKTSQLQFSANNKHFSITISAGIAIHDSAEEDFNVTMKQADVMLYHSKNAGRNRVSL